MDHTRSGNAIVGVETGLLSFVVSGDFISVSIGSRWEMSTKASPSQTLGGQCCSGTRDLALGAGDVASDYDLPNMLEAPGFIPSTV